MDTNINIYNYEIDIIARKSIPKLIIDTLKTIKFNFNVKSILDAIKSFHVQLIKNLSTLYFFEVKSSLSNSTNDNTFFELQSRINKNKKENLIKALNIYSRGNVYLNYKLFMLLLIIDPAKKEVSIQMKEISLN